MKFLLLLIVLAVVIYMLGAKRARPPAAEKPTAPPPPPAPPQDMIACAQCGLHLPRSEALPGRGGEFCSAAHRAAFESSGQHPQR